jgi:hypothetical protein
MSEPAVRRFDNWLEAFMEYTDNTEAPKHYRTWAAVSAIASALGRKVWVNIGRFPVSPSFFIIFVAPPGVATKSTAAKLAIDLLEEGKIANLFAGSLTEQAIFDELEDGIGQVSIGTTLMEMSNLSMFASELGVLLNNSDSGLVDQFVDIWDNKPKIQRRTRAEGKRDIPRPCINLLGCTTPGWLQENSRTYNIDGGLFSRTIFLYSDKKEKLIAYPEETTTKEFRDDVIKDLKTIGMMRGEFTMTKEAREFGEAWYDELYNNTPKHLKNEMFGGYIMRRQTHLHKTALVLSAAMSDDYKITEEHMVLAEALLIQAERGLGKIYATVMGSEKTQSYKLILQLAEAIPAGISKNALFRMVSAKCTLSEFEAGLQAAIFAGQIKLMDKGGDYVIKFVP